MPTQAERSAATRLALFEATVTALVEHGYAGASTTTICRSAGVSQGSLFRHYPNKGALLAAAAGELFARIIERFRERAFAIDPAVGTGRRRALVELLVDAYAWPDLQAAVELYVAARTDDELAAALGHLEPPHRATLHELAAALLPDVSGHPRFDAYVDLAIDAVQGFSIGRRHVLDDVACERARVELVDSLAGLFDHLKMVLGSGPRPDVTVVIP